MITKIKDKLHNNEEKLKDILEELGCTYIHKAKNKNGQDIFKFGRDETSSGNGNLIGIDTLHYKSFSRAKGGDIITLVGEILGIELGESIKWLANKLNLSLVYEKINVNLPFGGFWKELSKVKDIEDVPSPTYPMSRNNVFSEYGVSQLFIRDGISALTQEEFSVGYSIIDDRVTIPWLNCQGELVGIIARINKEQLTKEEEKFKYFPSIAFNKGKHLYGLYQNYNHILDSNTIIIVESEKSVLKAKEYGYHNVVAIGCNNITDFQAKLIKSMSCNVIVAFDEGITREHFIEQALKCKIENPFFSNEIYIVDMDRDCNPYIMKEKVCIFDLPEEEVKAILEEYTIYIG